MSNTLKKSLPGQEIELLSSNLRRLMRLQHIDSAELSKRTGIALTTINGLKRGMGNPTLSTLQVLSEFFNVSIGDLTEKCLETQQTKQKEAFEIPLIEMSSVENFLRNRKKYRHTIITELEHALPDQFFAVKINNNALQPLFDKGTVFVVLDEKKACDGDIVLVQFGGNMPCFRHIFLEGEISFFKPLTGIMQETPIKSTEFTICGIVIKAIQTFIER